MVDFNSETPDLFNLSENANECQNLLDESYRIGVLDGILFCFDVLQTALDETEDPLKTIQQFNSIFINTDNFYNQFEKWKEDNEEKLKGEKEWTNINTHPLE